MMLRREHTADANRPAKKRVMNIVCNRKDPIFSYNFAFLKRKTYLYILGDGGPSSEAGEYEYRT
jgi:hypothetical protein